MTQEIQVGNGDSWASIAGQLGDARQYEALAQQNGGLQRELHPGDTVTWDDSQATKDPFISNAQWAATPTGYSNGQEQYGHQGAQQQDYQPQVTSYLDMFPNSRPADGGPKTTIGVGTDGTFHPVVVPDHQPAPLAQSPGWPSLPPQPNNQNTRLSGRLGTILDIPSEGLERLTGFAAQVADSAYTNVFGNGIESNQTTATNKNILDQLPAAWYAGSLAYDTAFQPSGKGGMGALTAARQRITDLVGQGLSYGDALAQTSAEYKQWLGPANDPSATNTALHVLADPLVLAGPALRAITGAGAVAGGAQAASTAAEAGPAMPKIVQAAGQAISVDEAANTAARASKVVSAIDKIRSNLTARLLYKGDVASAAAEAIPEVSRTISRISSTLDTMSQSAPEYDALNAQRTTLLEALTRLRKWKP